MTIQHNEAAQLGDNIAHRDEGKTKCGICTRAVRLTWSFIIAGAYTNGGVASEQNKTVQLCWKCRLVALKQGHVEVWTEGSRGRLLQFPQVV